VRAEPFSVPVNSSTPSRFYIEEASSLFTTVGLVFQVRLQDSGDYKFWRKLPCVGVISMDLPR
jgi:hypothetical protein